MASGSCRFAVSMKRPRMSAGSFINPPPLDDATLGLREEDVNQDKTMGFRRCQPESRRGYSISALRSVRGEADSARLAQDVRIKASDFARLAQDERYSLECSDRITTGSTPGRQTATTLRIPSRRIPGGLPPGCRLAGPS